MSQKVNKLIRRSAVAFGMYMHPPLPESATALQKQQQMKRCLDVANGAQKRLKKEYANTTVKNRAEFLRKIQRSIT